MHVPIDQELLFCLVSLFLSLLSYVFARSVMIRFFSERRIRSMKKSFFLLQWIKLVSCENFYTRGLMEEQPSRGEMVRGVCCRFSTNSWYSHYCFRGKLSKGFHRECYNQFRFTHYNVPQSSSAFWLGMTQLYLLTCKWPQAVPRSGYILEQAFFEVHPDLRLQDTWRSTLSFLSSAGRNPGKYTSLKVDGQLWKNS